MKKELTQFIYHKIVISLLFFLGMQTHISAQGCPPNYDCNIAIVVCAGTFPQSFPNFADDTDGDGLVDDCAFTVCDGSGFVSRIQSNLPYASSVSVVVTFPEGLLGGGNPYPAGTVNTTFPIPPMGSASNGVFGPTLSNPTSETLCIDYVLTPNDPQCSTCQGTPVSYQVCFPPAAVEPIAQNCWDDYQYDGALCDYVNQGEQPAQPEMVNCYDEFEFDTDACAWMNVGVQPEAPTDPDCNGTAVFNNGTCTWDEIPDENYDCNIAIVVCAGTFPQSFPNFADDTDGDGLVDDCAFTVCDGSGYVSRIQSNLPYASSVSVVVTFPEGLLGGGNPYPAGTVNTTFPIPPMGSASNGVFGPTLSNPTSETLCIDYVLTPNDPQCSTCQGTPVSYQVCFPPAAVEPIAQNCWDDYQYDGALCDYVNQGEQPAQPEMVNCYDEFEFDTDACAWTNVGVQPEMPTDLDCDGTAVFNNGTCTWDEIPDENYDCNIAIVLCAGTFPQSFPNFADDTDGDGLVDDCAFTVCDGSGFVSRIQSNLPYASSVSVVVTFPEGLLGGGNPYPAGTVNTTFPIPPMGSASNGVFGPTLSNPTSETLCIDYVLTPNDPQCSTCQGTPVSYQVCFPPAAVEPIAQNCWDDYQYDGALCDYVNQGEQPAQPEMVNCYDEFEFDTDACAWMNVGVQPEAPTDPDCNGTAVFNNGTCTWDEIPDENYDCNIAIVLCAGTFPQSFPNFADDTDGDGLVDDCAFTVCDGSGFVSRIQSNLPYASSVSVVVTFPEGLLGGGNPYPAGTVNTTFPIPPMGAATNGVFGPTLSNPTSETLCIDYVLTPNDPQCSTCQGTPVSYQVCFPPAAVEPIAQNCWDDYQYDGALCDYVNQGEQPAQPEMVNCYDEFEFDTDACAWMNVGVQPEMPTDLDCDGTAVFNNGTCTWDEIPDENYDCNIAIVLCAGTFPQSFPNFADDTDGDGLVDDCAFTVCDGSGFVSRIQSNLPYASSVSVVVTFPEGLLGGGNPYPAGTVNTTFPIPPMGSASNGVFGPTLSNPTNETLCIDYVLTPNDPQCSTCQGTPVSYQVCFPPAAVEPIAQNCWDDYQYDGALCDYVNQGEQPAQPEMVNCYDEFEFDTDACAWMNVGVQPEAPTDPDCNGTAVFNNGTCTWDEIPDENYDCNIAIVVCAGTFPQSFPNFADDTDGDGLVDDCAFTVCDGSGFVSRTQSNLPYASSVSVVVTFPEGLLGGGNPYPAGTVNTTFAIPPMGSASNGVFGPTLSNPTNETLCIDYVLTPNDPQCSTCQGTPVSYQVCFPPAAVEPMAENCWDDYQFDGVICAYVNQGEQPIQPEVVNCWDDFQFDTDLCEWVNVGTEPIIPTLTLSAEEFCFNDAIGISISGEPFAVYNVSYTNIGSNIITANAAGNASYTIFSMNNGTNAQTGDFTAFITQMTVGNCVINLDNVSQDFEVCETPNIVICAGAFGSVPDPTFADDENGDSIVDDCSLALCSGEVPNFKILSDLVGSPTDIHITSTFQDNPNLIGDNVGGGFTNPEGQVFSITGPALTNTSDVTQCYDTRIYAGNANCGPQDDNPVNGCEIEPIVVTICVAPAVAPVISCPADIVQSSDATICGAVVDYLVTATSVNPITDLAGFTYIGSSPDGNQYFLSNNIYSWTDANIDAAANGGHLVTIDNPTTNALFSGIGFAWIGFTDEVTEGQFNWVTGETVSYTNWGFNGANSEPDDFDDGPLPQLSQDYGFINYPSNAGQWGDDFNEPIDLPGFMIDIKPYILELEGGVQLIETTGNFGSHSEFPVGTTNVCYQAIDNCGLMDECCFDVTIIDNTDPIALCQDVTISLDENGNSSTTAEAVNNGSTDACGIANLALNITEFDCSDVGSNAVILTATDNNGNSATCDAMITVIDEIPAEITCRQPISTTTTAGQCQREDLTVLPPFVLYDNCGIDSGIDISRIPAGNDFAVGTTTLVWTVTDSNGNPTQCESLVIVQDNEPPSVNSCTTSVDFLDPGSCMANVSIDVNAQDECGIESVEGDGDFLLPIGIHPQTITITDVNGNQTVHVVTVYVHDDQAPIVALCPQDMTVESSTIPTSVNLTEPQFSDNCGIFSIENDAPDAFPLGTTAVTYTAMDEYGNTVDCTYNVNVVSGVSFDNTIDNIDASTPTAEGASWIDWNRPQAQTSCETCTETDYPDYLYLGDFNGHQYFLFAGAVNWSEASILSSEMNGHLVSLNDEDENAFIQNQLPTTEPDAEPATYWTGLNDSSTEIAWENEDAYEYANFPYDITLNSDALNAAVLNIDGTWTMTNGEYQAAFIMERPCVNLVQTAPLIEVISAEGDTSHVLLSPDSAWDAGDYTVTYEATDMCENTASYSFDVSIAEEDAEYCNTGGTQHDVWVKRVVIEDHLIESESAESYTDNTAEIIALSETNVVAIQLIPGGVDLSSNTDLLYWRLWLDLNNDGDFFDANEQVYETSATSIVNLELPISADLLGQTLRTRISVATQQYPEACLEFADGEAEDYTLVFPEMSEDAGRSAGSFSLSPNPTDNYANLYFNDFSGENVVVTVYDNLGKVRLETKAQIEMGEPIRLDLRKFIDGIYFVKVQIDGKRMMTKRLVVDKLYGWTPGR